MMGVISRWLLVFLNLILHAVAKSKGIARKIDIMVVDEKDYYGEGYQDVSFRVPSIKKAESILGWKPKADLHTALKKTIDYYINSSKIGVH